MTPVSALARAPLLDLYRGMNGTEQRRGVELEALKRSGQIADWWFEGLTVKLADDLRYTPDFLIQHRDGSLWLEETKGFWREDAKAKCRMCAKLYPFPLRALVWNRKAGGWDIEVFREGAPYG